MSFACEGRTLQNWTEFCQAYLIFLYISLPFCAKKNQLWKVTSTFTNVQPDQIFVVSVCPPLNCEDTILIIYKRTTNIFASVLSSYERHFPIKHERKQINHFLYNSNNNPSFISKYDLVLSNRFSWGVVCLVNWKFKNNRNMYSNNDYHIPCSSY